ncbi:MAG: hypothetical protein JWR32_3611 [Mycobacterium sp.]|nr:hypothetical protein [Mycobacterium sp.]
MHEDDFFDERARVSGPAAVKLRTALLNSLRAGPLSGEDDLTCAIVQTRLVP